MAPNNNDSSKRIIHLKKSHPLIQSGLVTDSVYYIDTHEVKISLNHNASADIIFTINHKKWQNNLNELAKQAEENGISETKNILLLKSHVNHNHDEIIGINKT